MLVLGFAGLLLLPLLAFTEDLILLALDLLLVKLQRSLTLLLPLLFLFEECGPVGKYLALLHLDLCDLALA